MKMRVWFIPQVGVENGVFYVPVRTVEEAKKVMDILSAYDAFQLQHNIKPDYCNVGGVEIYNEEDGEWEDWYLETEDGYFNDVDEYIDSLENTEEIQKFTSDLFSQIDWDVINQM